MKGVTGRLPSAWRGGIWSAPFMLCTSPAFTAGEGMNWQLLFVSSEPLRNASLLAPAKDRQLRTTCGVIFVPWFKLKFLLPLAKPVQLSSVGPALLLFWSKPLTWLLNDRQFAT